MLVPSGVKRHTESSSLPFTKEQNRENELTAGKWTKACIGQKDHAVPLDKIDSTRLRFAVHQDEGIEQPSGPTPHKLVVGESNVLSAKKVSKEDDQHDVAGKSNNGLTRPPAFVTEPGLLHSR